MTMDITGDFTKSFDYYQKLVDKYNNAGKGDNTDYDKVFNNCLKQTNRGFQKSLGSMDKINMTMPTILKTPWVPNIVKMRMAMYFGNTSFSKP